MLIECQSCATRFRVDPERIPHPKTFVRCKSCGTPIYIDPALEGEEASEWAEARLIPAAQVSAHGLAASPPEVAAAASPAGFAGRSPGAATDAEAQVSAGESVHPDGQLVQCPHCQSRYRVPLAPLLRPRIKLKCSVCSHIFAPPPISSPESAAAPHGEGAGERLGAFFAGLPPRTPPSGGTGLDESAVERLHGGPAPGPFSPPERTRDPEQDYLDAVALDPAGEAVLPGERVPEAQKRQLFLQPEQFRARRDAAGTAAGPSAPSATSSATGEEYVPFSAGPSSATPGARATGASGAGSGNVDELRAEDLDELRNELPDELPPPLPEGDDFPLPDLDSPDAGTPGGSVGLGTDIDLNDLPVFALDDDETAELEKGAPEPPAYEPPPPPPPLPVSLAAPMARNPASDAAAAVLAGAVRPPIEREVAPGQVGAFTDRRRFLVLAALAGLIVGAIAGWGGWLTKEDGTLTRPFSQESGGVHHLVLGQSLESRTIVHRGGKRLFVVEGQLVNRFPKDTKLSWVRVRGKVYGDSGETRLLGTAQAYLGNILTQEQLETMELPAIAAYGAYNNGRANENFEIPPGRQAPFQLVFLDVSDPILRTVAEVAGYTRNGLAIYLDVPGGR
jgi:predicted Zn finger-like uncharacterized protein